MAKMRRGRPGPVEPRHIDTIVRNTGLIAKRHEEIFKAASHVFLSRGYHGATVREIAEQAGLSLGGLYSYIRTKGDILYLVFERLTTTLRENIRQAIAGIEDPVAQIEAALRADLETIERYQDEILLMYQETKSLDPESLRAVLSRNADHVRFFEEILRAGYDRGVFKGDPSLSAEVIIFLCAVVALRRWSLRRRFSADEVREGLVAFILRALGAPEGPGKAGGEEV